MKFSVVWIAIFSVAIGFAFADEMNEIQIYPDNAQSTEKGEDLVLTCVYVADVIENVRWFDPNGAEVTSTDQRLLEVEQSSLLLTLVDVSYDDEGLYTCTGVNKENNETISMTRDVGVYEPVEFVNTEKLQEFEIRTTAIVVCNVVGNPPPTIYWLRGTDKISTSEEKYEIDSGNLIIANISKEDEGQYVCKARERAKGQNIMKSIMVKVQIPPEIIGFSPEITVVEGNFAQLTCEATGKPEPMFRWHKGGALEANESTILVNGSVLGWDEVLRSDGGEYTCVAYNEVTSVSKTTMLIVQVKPYFIISISDSTRQGQTAHIECTAQGDPIPNVVIYKDGVYMEETADAPVEEIDDGNTTSSSTTGSWSSNRIIKYDGNSASIDFLYTEPSDAGEYECKAENAAGITNEMLMLVVKYSPRDTELKDQYTCPDQAPTFECYFDANPAPELEWGQMVTPDGDLEYKENSTFQAFNATDPPYGYIIEDVNGILALTVDVSLVSDPYQTYYCRGQNEIGFIIEDATLMPATVPEPPLEVTVKNKSTQQATISFTEPLFSSVPNKFYIIRLLPTNGSIRTEETNLHASSSEYTFTELQHDTEYTVVVETQNCVDVSAPSEEIKFRTDAIVLPDALDILSGESSEEKFTVTWRLNGLGGGEISKISFVVRKENEVLDNGNSSSVYVDMKSFAITPSDEEFQKQSMTIEDLEPGSKYEISVNVHNEVGMAETKHLFVTLARPQTTTVATTIDDQLGAASIDTVMIIIIVAVLLLLLIIIDVVCFFTRSWGCTMWVYLHTCGKSKKKKIEDAEEGSAEFRNNEHEGKFREELEEKIKSSVKVEEEKQPLAEEAEPVANGELSKLTPICEQTPLRTEEPAVVPPVSGNGTTEGARAPAENEGGVRNEKETPSQPQEEEKLVKGSNEAEEKDA